MRRVLILQTFPSRTAEEVLAEVCRKPGEADLNFVRIDLSSGQTDYAAVLEAVFAADVVVSLNGEVNLGGSAG